MDMQRGLLCGLTGNYANFNDKCPDFIKDEAEAERKLNLELAAVGDEAVGSTTNYGRNKKIGIALFAVGCGVTLFSLLGSEKVGFGILWYGAIISGILMYSKGVQQEKIIKKNKLKDIN
jgi:hypothetical protein